jgi:hypothetical protein
MAARIGAFEAAWCHARITPASLQRGRRAQRRRRQGEAAGGNPKFEMSCFRRPAGASTVLASDHPKWHEVKQSLPAA